MRPPPTNTSGCAVDSNGPIHVVLASNANYFFGLLATVLSLLRSNPRNAFSLHIIDGGLTAPQKEALSDKAKRSHSAVGIECHALDASVFAGLRRDYGNSYMTYARILVGTLVPAPRVLYLDTDLLIAADVNPLWTVDLGTDLVAAAPDRGIKTVTQDFPFEMTGSDAPYFNAGVMVIDLDRWRRERIQEQLLEMLTAAPERYRWWDQTAMNVLFRGQVRFVESGWNTFADEIAFEAGSHGRIYHFVGSAKPWTRHFITPEYALWRAFFSRYAYPSQTLYETPTMVSSRAAESRYSMLARSPFLAGTARFVIGMKSRLQRRDAASAIQTFDQRLRLHAEHLQKRESLERAITAYAARVWGAAEAVA